jgi:hypothetical protein
MSHNVGLKKRQRMGNWSDLTGFVGNDSAVHVQEGTGFPQHCQWLVQTGVRTRQLALSGSVYGAAPHVVCSARDATLSGLLAVVVCAVRISPPMQCNTVNIFATCA